MIRNFFGLVLLLTSLSSTAFAAPLTCEQLTVTGKPVRDIRFNPETGYFSYYYFESQNVEVKLIAYAERGDRITWFWNPGPVAVTFEYIHDSGGAQIYYFLRQDQFESTSGRISCR